MTHSVCTIRRNKILIGIDSAASPGLFCLFLVSLLSHYLLVTPVLRHPSPEVYPTLSPTHCSLRPLVTPLRDLGLCLCPVSSSVCSKMFITIPSLLKYSHS